jgi:acyl-CoA thioester hydrolase
MAVQQMEHRVCFGDTDAMGIVYYANYFRYFERVRNEWFRKLYKTPILMIEEENYLPVVKAHCNYHQPASYEDVLVMECWVPADQRRGATVRFEYEIKRAEDGATLVTGYTVHTFTDSTRKLKRPPREFLDAMKTLGEERSIQSDTRF